MIFCLSGSSDAGNPNLFSPPAKNFSYFLRPGRYPPSLISQKFTFEGAPVFWQHSHRDFDRPSPTELSPVMPAVSVLRMDLCVAGSAQGDQVAPLMGATLGQRQLMVDLLGLHIPSFLQALLTQRMLRRVLIADPFPSPSVSAAYSRIPTVLLVAAILFFLVFLTEPPFRQVRASRPGTRPLRFPRQYSHLLRA